VKTILAMAFVASTTMGLAPFARGGPETAAVRPTPTVAAQLSLSAHHSLVASAPQAGAKPGGFALAKHQWELGASASSAAQGRYWGAAAKDLKSAVAAKAPGTSKYAHVASSLEQLAGLPDAMQTPAQQKESLADVEAINAFFGTNGLYDTSAPSPTAAAFVATLQQEALLGTLSVIADARLAKAPTTYPGAGVTCPVLSSLANNGTFGCKLTTSKIGTYYLVGTVLAAHATSYTATIAKGSALFDCSADGLGLPQELAAKRLGGGCK
jgi:hypothetical protein